MGQICYFLWMSHNKKLSASGAFAPLTRTRGSAPGPHWGLCPQTPDPHYRLALPRSPYAPPLPKWNPEYAPGRDWKYTVKLAVHSARYPRAACIRQLFLWHCATYETTHCSLDMQFWHSVMPCVVTLQPQSKQSLTSNPITLRSRAIQTESLVGKTNCRDSTAI